mgnify:CR=1 FL=1
MQCCTVQSIRCKIKEARIGSPVPYAYSKHVRIDILHKWHYVFNLLAVHSLLVGGLLIRQNQASMFG